MGGLGMIFLTGNQLGKNEILGPSTSDLQFYNRIQFAAKAIADLARFFKKIFACGKRKLPHCYLLKDWYLYRYSDHCRHHQHNHGESIGGHIFVEDVPHHSLGGETNFCACCLLGDEEEESEEGHESGLHWLDMANDYEYFQ